MYPSISCLCPSYGRPTLLMNAVACFLAQDYPVARRKLVILDDLGTISPCVAEYSSQIEVHSTEIRFASLPEKYNAAWRIAPVSDIYVVWEDDDAQLPWCLTSHALALAHHQWSQPSEVWSDYAGNLHTEPTGGRFHGSLAFRRSALEALDGWPLTRRADFDQQMISRLRSTFGEPGDPNVFAPSSPYVFRWAHGYPHGQGTMRAPDDEGWYDRYQPPDRSGLHSVIPRMDEQTQEFYRRLAGSTMQYRAD